MADVFTKDKRRQIMQSVRRENTKPETMFADLLRSMNLQFLQHPQHLPGRPDFHFPAANIVVFVHGCFWHGHDKCTKGKTLSKSNYEYWQMRINRNKRRDRRVTRKLREAGFSVYTVWECEIKKRLIPTRLVNRIKAF
jgi:DNA mismatch endonuclease (patch repair protein)